MTSQEAIRILMLSPLYFKIPPADRKKLVEEYCEFFNQAFELQSEAVQPKK